MGYGSDIYRIFSPFFYDLVGLYEINFNRDPKHLVDYDKVPNSSEILPIYGESALPKYALYLAQLPIVNRLSEIKQLAYTYILFPGATHTRYEHSRGVMYKGLILLDKSRELLKKECQITLTEDDELIVGISGLLHDLGHSAWGHALDGISGYVVELLEEISYYLFSPKKNRYNNYFISFIKKRANFKSNF